MSTSICSTCCSRSQQSLRHISCSPNPSTTYSAAASHRCCLAAGGAVGGNLRLEKGRAAEQVHLGKDEEVVSLPARSAWRRAVAAHQHLRSGAGGC
jgi:hypothetical protein